MFFVVSLWSIYTLFLHTQHVEARCYTPNGSDRNEQWSVADGYIYAPCNPNAKVSMCCAIGPGREGSKNNCLESGLCLGGSVIWRESCTDPTWQDPACIKLFLNGTGYDEAAGIQRDSKGQIISDVLVTQCGDGSWCSGSNNRGCCSQGQGVFLVNGKQTNTNPASSSPTSSRSPTSTTAPSTSATSSSTKATSSSTTSLGLSSVTSSSLATTDSTSSTTSLHLETLAPSEPTRSSATSTSIPSPPSTEKQGLSTGLKVGIGVAAGIAATVIVAAAWWAWSKRQVRQPDKSHEEMGYDRAMLDSKPVDASKYRTEIGNNYAYAFDIVKSRAWVGPPVELPGKLS